METIHFALMNLISVTMSQQTVLGGFEREGCIWWLSLYLACSPALAPWKSPSQWRKTQSGILLLHNHICKTCCSMPQTLPTHMNTHRQYLIDVKRCKSQKYIINNTKNINTIILNYSWKDTDAAKRVNLLVINHSRIPVSVFSMETIWHWLTSTGDR